MPRIKILSESLANRIAAGEVVERPAAIVKELIENAVDAGSTKIEVNIENAGQSLIEIIDNGHGMETEDIKKACLRHATSKIDNASDLMDIHTLGFRGEALASIAAVSMISISSCCDDQNIAQTLDVEASKTKALTKSARSRGTTVSVKKLFYNTPARLKFLKSKSTETAQIFRVFYEQALAYPNISFKLVNNNQEVSNLAGNNTLLERIKLILGSKITDSLIPLSFNISPLKISGFISKAGHSFASRKNQYIFVNKRAITDKTIAHAIIQAYQTYLMERQFPAIFLFIEMPADLLDVNVHPTKREVRFRDGAVLHDMLVKIMRDALSAKADLPEFVQRSLHAASAPDQDANLFAEKTRGVHYCGTLDHAEVFKRQMPNDNLPEAEEPDQALFEKVRLLQANQTYIIAQDETGLIVIDQHAAHERVLFDALLSQFKEKRIEKQKLLLPITIHLDKGEFLLMQENKAVFENLGFDIEEFGKDAFAIYAYPAVFETMDINAEFKKIIADMMDLDISGDMNEKITKVLAPIACHAAVRAGDTLSGDQIPALFDQLFRTDAPYTCPHGRPTIVKISWNELERKFKRKV